MSDEWWRENVGVLLSGTAHALQWLAAHFPVWLGREAALVLFVMIMIVVIATVTGGDTQNTDLGPVAIRKHVRPRAPVASNSPKQKVPTVLKYHVEPKGVSVALRKKRTNNVRQSIETIFVPKEILEGKNDGVIADCAFYYAYERGGQLQKKRLVSLKHVQMRVVGVKIPPLEIVGGANAIQADRVKGASMIRGSEIDENFSLIDVVLPEVTTDQSSETVAPTEQKALEHASRTDLLKNWQSDDALRVITVSQDLVEEIASARNQFLSDAVRSVQALRLRKWPKAKPEEIDKLRPTVVGTYVIRLSFPKNPWFVLRRHPDRDVRITAWLTVLTSVFAMLMEVWPLRTSWIDRAEAGSRAQSEAPVQHPTPRARR